ncbi:MAG: 4Fe-4S binding protein [Elusimicrobiota bacterium]|nr:4Fe-4S binding protein [Elusimicrobiota bacterium]
MKKNSLFLFRRIVHVVSLFLLNGHFKTFLTGSLYGGKLKNICIPVLNCHSCPLALTACPVGMIQQFLALGVKNGYSGFLYIFGLIGIPSMFLGRFFCGWICPFGFLQELIFVKKFKLKFPAFLKYLKHILFFGFVLLFPLLFKNNLGIGTPTFCKYICPAGTAEAGFWGLASGVGRFSFVLFGKIIILAAVIFFSLRIRRFFCRICPMGLLLGFFNKVSFLQLRVNDKCDNCGVCKKVCPVDVDMPRDLSSINCIRCGKCVDACPQKALSLSFRAGK